MMEFISVGGFIPNGHSTSFMSLCKLNDLSNTHS